MTRAFSNNTILGGDSHGNNHHSSGTDRIESAAMNYMVWLVCALLMVETLTYKW